ncbi:tRNA pseudouridine(38-40) synthase TruA [Chitinophaga caeni]|uniref:tRNA pseudouridine synthase A n=1 Tax=Chitinophaga caeni TaxID=2029983 RepID=A0A291QTP4_9BACT|nr:tRNA pseudouridine(38-40) synthase TruA [Chitinophaga caeni]ATL47233.1 tRNA pseudouridine(38-40) synthase TruA [Chitinophaga caeni]
MARYFIEVAYMGGRYSGFQIQDNGSSVQGELDHALSTILRVSVQTTGSSRTDSGVHARQNFLHFDFERELHPQLQYKLNAILPKDIVVNGIYAVSDEAHSRFDATGRSYTYTIYTIKDPFLVDRGYFFPYKMDKELLDEAAKIVMQYSDFETFSKRNTQVRTYNCKIEHSYWEQEGELLRYHVAANRFLRGMVRGLVGTMLKVGRGKLSIDEFHAAIQSKDCKQADFAVPPQGLSLMKVAYPPELLSNKL